MQSAALLEPEEFLMPSEERAGKLREMAKEYYDAVRSQTSSNSRSKASMSKTLPQLLVGKDYDDEQVWAQIKIFSEPFMAHIDQSLTSLDRQTAALPEIKDEEEEQEEEDLEEEVASDEEDEEELDEDERLALEEEEGGIEDDDDDEDIEEGEEEEKNDEEEKEKEETKGPVHEGLDDGFFSMSGMQKFVEEAEAMEPDLDDMNLLDEAAGEDEEDEGEKDAWKSDKHDLKFNEFFETKSWKPEIPHKQPKEQQEEVEEEEEEQEEGEKTEHQKRMEEMKKKITRLEDEAVADKHWTMRGEVSAKERPKDSLLDASGATVEWESGARPPAPAPAEETTEAMADLIRRRIAESLYDDVELRKADSLLSNDDNKRAVPEADPADASARKGLGEVYEQAYKDKMMAPSTTAQQPEKLTEEQQEIEHEFNRICAKLDGLASFHFAPKPEKEMTAKRLKDNVAAVSMEEKVPIAVSSGTLMAPEEVHEKASEELKSKEEMTREENKAAHRAHKRQKKKVQERLGLNKAGEGKTVQINKAMDALRHGTGVVGSIRGKVTIANTSGQQGRQSREFRSKNFFKDIQNKQQMDQSGGKHDSAATSASKSQATVLKL